MWHIQLKLIFVYPTELYFYEVYNIINSKVFRLVYVPHTLSTMGYSEQNSRCRKLAPFVSFSGEKLSDVGGTHWHSPASKQLPLRHWISVWEAVLSNRVNCVLPGYAYPGCTNWKNTHNGSVDIGGRLRSCIQILCTARDVSSLTKSLAHIWDAPNFCLVGTEGYFCWMWKRSRLEIIHSPPSIAVISAWSNISTPARVFIG